MIKGAQKATSGFLWLDQEDPMQDSGQGPLDIHC